MKQNRQLPNSVHRFFLAGFPVATNGSEYAWKAFSNALKNVSAHHDVFMKLPSGSSHESFKKKSLFKII